MGLFENEAVPPNLLVDYDIPFETGHTWGVNPHVQTSPPHDVPIIIYTCNPYLHPFSIASTTHRCYRRLWTSWRPHRHGFLRDSLADDPIPGELTLRATMVCLKVNGPNIWISATFVFTSSRVSTRVWWLISIIKVCRLKSACFLVKPCQAHSFTDEIPIFLDKS